jgi:hypothetical protein
LLLAREAKHPATLMAWLVKLHISITPPPLRLEAVEEACITCVRQRAWLLLVLAVAEAKVGAVMALLVPEAEAALVGMQELVGVAAIRSQTELLVQAAEAEAAEVGTVSPEAEVAWGCGVKEVMVLLALGLLEQVHLPGVARDRLDKQVTEIQIGLRQHLLVVLDEVACLVREEAALRPMAINNPAPLAQSASSGPAQLAHSHPLMSARHKEKTTCLQKLKMVW